MSDDDIALSEKRMYGEKRPETHAYVASGLGVTRVETAGGQIGRFSLVERCRAHDIAGSNGEIAVATAEDILVLTADGEFAETGFGPAVAVGYDDAGLLAASPDGTVARDDGEWTELGSVGEVRAVEDSLLGAADGVYSVPELTRLGLADINDVSAGYAATATGLYRQGRANDEWTEVRTGPHHVVASDGERVHATSDEGLFELVDEDWEACSLPVSERVVDVTYSDDTYAITEDGTFLVETDAESTADGHGGWRQRSLGVPEIVGIAVA